MLTERWRLALTAGALIVTGAGVPAQAQEVPQPRPPARQEVPEDAAVQAPRCPARPLTWWERHKLRLQECVVGFPEEFKAPPLGESVYAFYRAHVANGEAGRMVLYQFDFCEGRPDLTLRGHDRLAVIADLLLHNHFPVVIERTPWNPAVAEARRLAVINEFAHLGLPIAPERVVIGVPVANGLAGMEALAVYQNMLMQTQGGATQSSIAGGGGGFVGAGVGTTGQGTGTSGRSSAPQGSP
jgi:hypothetical protein